MPRVTRTEGFEAYSVRAGYKDQEWATILIRGWQAPGNDGTPREIGEIMIHSSYGSWAYQWGHLGKPFKAWLAKCEDKHYVAVKFMGIKAYEFDGEETVRELRRRLLEKRRHGEISKDDARVIWAWIDHNESDLEFSDDRFVEWMHDGLRACGLDRPGARIEFFDEPWERRRKRLNRSFDCFWREIMPPFQATLREELAQKEAA